MAITVTSISLKDELVQKIESLSKKWNLNFNQTIKRIIAEFQEDKLK